MRTEPSAGVAAALLAGLASLTCHVPETVVSVLPPEQLAVGQIDYLEAGHAAGRSVGVRVDPRIELFCIMAQLAGYEEYSAPLDYAYARAVREHFEPYREHAAVKRMRSLRRWKNIAYDAVISLAIHVTDPPALAERVPFDQQLTSLEERWTPEITRTLLEDARNFVIDTDFVGFWRSQRPAYELAEARFAEALDGAPLLEWLDSFFVIQDGMRFYGVPGMLTGGSSYGATCRDPEQAFVYQVIGVSQVDDVGAPVFPPEMTGGMVHEYAHAFVNPIVLQASEKLRPYGEILFSRMEQEMRSQAYGSWSSVMCESLVRAATVRYFQEYDSEERAATEVRQQLAASFIWVEPLAELLEQYELERAKYATLEAFTPRLEAFFRRYTGRIDATLDEWESRLTYWRQLNPIVGAGLRRESVAQLNEVNRILDRIAFDPDEMRRTLDTLPSEHELRVTVLDAAGEFVYHADGLTGSSDHHRDVRGRATYRDLIETQARDGVVFHVDAVSGDRNMGRVNVIAFERYEPKGWLLCVEGHEWQRRGGSGRL
ncbi:MAG: hypothetical protein ACI8QZ_002919 [Chlamydiales bacterium]|jgi:hypothetical protein